MSSRGGFSMASDGRLITTTSAVTTSQFSGGWAIRNDGAAYISDLIASAVPATAKFIGGQAFSQAGVAYCTTQAVAASDVYQGGVRLRADGAVRIVVGSPTIATDMPIGGWYFKQSTGQLYVQEIA